MSSPIPGLKIKNNKLLVYNATSKEWEEADTKLVPAVGELLKRISQVQFRSAPVRQGLILEDQYDLGTGKIKAYKDIDGDMQMTFEAGNKEVFSIDEDAAFNEFQTNNRKGMDGESEPVNYWGGSTTVSRKIPSDPAPGKSGSQKRRRKKVEKDNSSSSDSISALGTRKKIRSAQKEVADTVVVSSDSSLSVVEENKDASGDAKATLLDRVPIRISIKGTTAAQSKELGYKKRESKTKNSKRQNVLDTIKARFLKSYTVRPQGGFSPDREYTAQSAVKFMSRRVCRVAKTCDPGIFLGMLRYNSRTRTTGNFESEFFLEDDTGPN